MKIAFNSALAVACMLAVGIPLTACTGSERRTRTPASPASTAAESAPTSNGTQTAKGPPFATVVAVHADAYSNQAGSVRALLSSVSGQEKREVERFFSEQISAFSTLATLSVASTLKGRVVPGNAMMGARAYLAAFPPAMFRVYVISQYEDDAFPGLRRSGEVKHVAAARAQAVKTQDLLLREASTAIAITGGEPDLGLPVAYLAGLGVGDTDNSLKTFLRVAVGLEGALEDIAAEQLTFSRIAPHTLTDLELRVGLEERVRAFQDHLTSTSTILVLAHLAGSSGDDIKLGHVAAERDFVASQIDNTSEMLRYSGSEGLSGLIRKTLQQFAIYANTLSLSAE